MTNNNVDDTFKVKINSSPEFSLQPKWISPLKAG